MRKVPPVRLMHYGIFLRRDQSQQTLLLLFGLTALVRFATRRANKCWWLVACAEC